MLKQKSYKLCGSKATGWEIFSFKLTLGEEESYGKGSRH